MCKNPCVECPFRRNSAPGYLGAASGNPIGFIWPHWQGNLHLPCHMAVDWTKDDCQEQALKKHTCIGYATMCKNTAKLPYNEDDAAAVARMEPDRDNVFTHIGEFVQHHGGNAADLMNFERVRELVSLADRSQSKPE